MISGWIGQNLIFVSSWEFSLKYPNNILLEFQAIADVIKANTDENDKITVLGNCDIIYLLSERKSASVYSYQIPIADIDTKIKEKYISDVEKLDAKIIVIDRNSIFMSGSAWHKELDPTINENYVLVQKIGTTEIYKLK